MKDEELKLKCSYSSLPDKFFSYVNPENVPKPEMKLFNEDLAKELGLPTDFLKSDEGRDILSGNRVLKEPAPIAEAYAGHQFGHFTMLGDGRAVLLGEYEADNGKTYDIQLKGSGRTPYSRGGDGKAALGPMLREYIISEAMEGLNIPTTRSLAVVSTGEELLRQEGYVPGAVLTRIADSHLRVGTFQYAERFGNLDDLKALADYAIDRHYPEVKEQENLYLGLLEMVIESQGKLIAQWQMVGFIHGVMNTDNMAISGETIDYGPCAFMDEFDSDTVFSSIDREGRYAYGNQPKMAAWNLARLAEALIPLLDEDREKAIKLAEEALGNFRDAYWSNWYRYMGYKLGIFDLKEDDGKLFIEFFKILEKYKPDYTNVFYFLTKGDLDSMEVFKTSEFNNWREKWDQRLQDQGKSPEEVIDLMESNNPWVIPRNYLVEEALAAAVNNDDYKKFNELLEAVRRPFDYDRVSEEFTKSPQKPSYPYKTYCGT